MRRGAGEQGSIGGRGRGRRGKGRNEGRRGGREGAQDDYEGGRWRERVEVEVIGS